MNDFAQVPDAIVALRAGRPVLVLDDTERENEGDVILAAELATAEWLAWTIRHTSGYLCALLPDELAEPLHPRHGQGLRRLEAHRLHSVGGCRRRCHHLDFSAADLNLIARAAGCPGVVPSDLIRPGQRVAAAGPSQGVLERPGDVRGGSADLVLAGRLRWRRSPNWSTTTDR